MNKAVLVGIAVAVAIGIAVIAIAQPETLENTDVPSDVGIQEESSDAGKTVSLKLSESLSMKSP